MQVLKMPFDMLVPLATVRRVELDVNLKLER
jgi:hypothetical protein